MGRFSDFMGKAGAVLGITVATTSCIYNDKAELNEPANINAQPENPETVVISQAPSPSSQDINIDEWLDNTTDCIEELSDSDNENETVSDSKAEISSAPPDPPENGENNDNTNDTNEEVSNMNDETDICEGNEMDDFGVSDENTENSEESAEESMDSGEDDDYTE